MTQLLAIDIEAGGLLGGPEIAVAVIEETYVARYLTPAFDLEGASHAEAIREKVFTHLGAAVAWCRRALFRLEVSGDHIELQVMQNGEEVEAFDITLGAIIPWRDNNGISRGFRNHEGFQTYQDRPTKRCRPRSHRD